MALADIRTNRYDEPLGIYALSCFDAAAALFERADDGHGLVDYSFYAAAQSLRHGLELLAKQLSIYIAYDKRDPSLLYGKGHPLEGQWELVKTFFAEHTYELSSRTDEDFRHHADVLEGLAEQFNRLDPAGTLFRYPEDVKQPKNGPRSVVDTPVPFDTVNLGDWKASSRAALVAATLILDVVEEWADDIARERGHVPRQFHKLAMGEPQK